MRCPKFLFLVVAALLMGAANMPMPSDAAADEPAASQMTDPSPVVAAVVPVEPPAPVPAVAVDPGAAIQAAADAAQAHAWGALVVALAGLLAFVLALVLHRTSLSDNAARWLSVALTGLAAIASNTALGAMTDAQSILLYALGPVVTAVVGALSPKRTTGLAAVLVVAGLLAAGGAGMYACSAAQVRDMRIAGADALACLTQCGASEAVTTIKDWGDDGSIKLTWKDASKDMLKCAEPCLWGLGIAAFQTYALSAPYFGSAEEACIYGGSMTEIVVSPRKEK